MLHCDFDSAARSDRARRDQNSSKIVHLNIATTGLLRGWCNSSTNASSLECVPSSIWQSGDHLNFLAGGSRYYTPASGDLDVWTQDPRPFVDGKPHGDAGSQSFVPLPKLVPGTTLPPDGPNYMVAGGMVLGTCERSWASSLCLTLRVCHRCLFVLPSAALFMAAEARAGRHYSVRSDDKRSETFTSYQGPDGPVHSSEGGGGKYGWDITNDCDGRTLTFGWLSAACGNCKPQVSPQRLSIVREVMYDPRLRQLVSSPLPELAKLHGDTICFRKDLRLDAGEREVLLPVGALAARSMDVQLNVSLRRAAGAVDVRIAVLSPTEPAHVGQGAIMDINVTAKAADGSRNGTLHVWTDSYPRRSNGTTHADGLANFTERFVVLPHEDTVDLRALVDFSSVE
eukprot:SAG11_NODE_521_length_8777_cov_17.940770_5_plen_398_part_00